MSSKSSQSQPFVSDKTRDTELSPNDQGGVSLDLPTQPDLGSGVNPPSDLKSYTTPAVISSAPDLSSLRVYRDDLAAQILEIEKFIGFVEHAGDLAVRVAKIESFLGVNRK